MAQFTLMHTQTLYVSVCGSGGSLLIKRTHILFLHPVWSPKKIQGSTINTGFNKTYFLETHKLLILVLKSIPC